MSGSPAHLTASSNRDRGARRTRPPRALIASLVLGLAIAGAGLVVPSGQAAPAAAAVSDPALASKIASVLRDSRVTSGRTSVVVLDAASGDELFQRSAGRALLPASNTKIVTAAAAMHTLGPGYRFSTQVIRRAKLVGGTLHGRLYLKGYGDPTARVGDYAALARQVRAAGIRTVTGKLIVDASYFDAVRYHPAWRRSYAGEYYAAETSALTVAPNADYDSGTMIVSYRPGKAGKRAKISTSPAAAAAYVRIVNKTTTGRRGSSSTFRASRAYGSNTVTLTGRVPLGRTGSRLITVHRPELYAGAVFRAELRKAGVRVAGGTKVSATPAGKQTVLATDYSMTLSALLVPFLKLSNNMHAEALTKAMGARVSGAPGTWAKGVAASRAYLAGCGAPMAGVRLSDGSGLTRANTLTPRALGALLVYVQRESWFPAFRSALPVAGNRSRMVGGTLRHRMTGTRAANNAWAKTGTLTGVTALSGYARGRDGTMYVFAMLSEYSGRSPRPVEDQLVLTLAGWRR